MFSNSVQGVAVALLLVGRALAQSNPSKEAAVRAHTQQAQQYLRSNQPEQAMEEFQAVLAADPNDLDARGNLGVLEFFKGNYARAAEQLRAALKLRADIPKLQALLGMSEKRTGEITSAQADIESAFPHLEEEKLRVEAGLELVEVDYALNDLSKAAEVVNVLRQLRPTDKDILYTAHRVYSDLSDETTLSLAMVAPDSARMHQLMAHELARRADRDGAIAHYRAALKLEPNRSDLHFELADMLGSSSSATDQAEAEKEYREALKENPFDERSVCRLGDIDAKRADPKEALEYYSRALRLQPNDPDANLGYAKVLMSLHEPQKALGPLEHAVELEPFNATSHYRLGVLYRELGKAAESKHELAEFERLKGEKNKLQSLYEQMRLQPGKELQKDADGQP